MQINGLLDRLLQEGSLTLMGGSRKPRPPFDLAADGDDLGVLHRCAGIGDAFAQLQNAFARVLQVGAFSPGTSLHVICPYPSRLSRA